MDFKNRLELEHYLGMLSFLGLGSQGESFLNPNRNQVFKIYHDADYINATSFLGKENATFIFPKEEVRVDGKLVGYISNYVPASSLYKVDFRYVNLNTFLRKIKVALKDIELLTKEGIAIYDIMYNILLGKKGIYVIDTDDYRYSGKEEKDLYRSNVKGFNLEIMYFLVNGYFEEVVKSNRRLKAMYNSHGIDMSIVTFIEELKEYLSTLMGYEVKQLSQAKKLVNKKEHAIRYQRELI